MTPQVHSRTLKALSLILSYPTEELQQAMPENRGRSDRRTGPYSRRQARPEPSAGRSGTA